MCYPLFSNPKERGGEGMCYPLCLDQKMCASEGMWWKEYAKKKH